DYSCQSADDSYNPLF
nr:immunoglobulin light chain junction region [Macaca mulatta]